MSSDAVADRLVRGACRSVEGVVRAFFALRRPFSVTTPRLSPVGDERILVVAPHPDDEAAGCAGSLLAHRAAGDETRVLVVTDGRRSRAFGLDPDEMARRRRREAHEAAAALDATLGWIGLREGAWRAENLSRTLEEELEEFAPTVVYAPSRVDFHPEHLRVARALARVVAGRCARVRVYQAQVPLAGPLVNLVGDVTRYARTVEAILRSYETQWGSLERTLRLRRYAGARHGGGGLAEEFWEMSAERYADLHGEPNPCPLPFRGLRHRPFTDLLAYLVGRNRRRALVEMSS